MRRRDFLKFAGTSIAASLLPVKHLHALLPVELPAKIDPLDLPESVRSVLGLTPKLRISQDGNLYFYNPLGKHWARSASVQTVWNQERSGPRDRLQVNSKWSIVLHWFGDNENHELDLDGYMRGFDSLRQVADYVTRTSAHFLVGDLPPHTGRSRKDIGILQAQQADADGVPFLASHIAPLDYIGHWQQKQYFVRALYSLAAREPGVHSSLQDYFDGPRVDANRSTIAIEITGSDFENLAHTPSNQKVANVLALVWALMKRYRISAMDLLGHHEIQLAKSDPGKKFMAWMRFLVGVKALVEQDAEMLELVFGSFFSYAMNWQLAARKYFAYVRDQLVMVSTPQRVYEWERTCGYWIFVDMLLASSRPVMSGTRSPMLGQPKPYGKHFLRPDSHEGLDFYNEKLFNKRARESIPVHLIADGECLHIGTGGRCHTGVVAVFRHLQADGAQVLSVYGNLAQAARITVGRRYSAGDLLGVLDTVHSHADPYLHFAMAYGAAWDTDQRTVVEIPLNAQSSWIRDRFLDPDNYLRSCGSLDCESRNLKP